MPLPADYRIERPDRADAAETLALVHAADLAAIGFADFDPEQVEEAFGADPAADNWLVRDPDGLLVGWGYLDEPDPAAEEVYCEAYLRPGADPAVQAVLVDLLVARVRERAAGAGLAEVALKAAAVAEERDYLQVLAAAGFTFERQHARMTLPLTGAEQPPAPVSGYRLRPLAEADRPECHELLATTFADTAHPYRQGYAEFAALPAIRWAECLVAEAEGGGLAGVVISTGGEQADEGWVKWLGVRAEHRGRGLAAALLRAEFAIFAGLGRTKVGLGVDTTNPTGAYRLYESLGMSPAYVLDIHQLLIRP